MENGNEISVSKYSDQSTPFIGVTVVSSVKHLLFLAKRDPTNL